MREIEFKKKLYYVSTLLTWDLAFFVDGVAWSKAISSTTDFILCKDLAMNIWGPQDLKQRSVTGQKCRRYKDNISKPDLTPEKVDAVSHN